MNDTIEDLGTQDDYVTGKTRRLGVNETYQWLSLDVIDKDNVVIFKQMGNYLIEQLGMNHMREMIIGKVLRFAKIQIKNLKLVFL